MKARVIGFTTHHSLKMAMPLGVTAVLVDDVRGKSWLFNVTSIVAFMMTSILLWMAFSHAQRTHSCEKCNPKSSEVLDRPVYQAWSRYSQWGVIPPAFLFVAVIVSMPFLFKPSPHAKTEFNWGPSMMLIAMILIAGSAIATLRYRSLNYPGVKKWNPVQSFMDGQARGQWLKHKALLVYICALFAASATTFIPFSGFWGVVKGAVLLLFVFSIYASHRHSMSLCEQCAVDFRVDAPEYATKHRKRFAIVHRFGWMSLASILISMVVGNFFHSPYHSYFFVTSLVISGCFTLLERFHSSYQPWCPYCRKGGGGHGETEPAPDPSGDHGRPLPVA